MLGGLGLLGRQGLGRPMLLGGYRLRGAMLLRGRILGGRILRGWLVTIMDHPALWWRMMDCWHVVHWCSSTKVRLTGCWWGMARGLLWMVTSNTSIGGVRVHLASLRRDYSWSGDRVVVIQMRVCIICSERGRGRGRGTVRERGRGRGGGYQHTTIQYMYMKCTVPTFGPGLPTCML